MSDIEVNQDNVITLNKGISKEGKEYSYLQITIDDYKARVFLTPVEAEYINNHF